MTTLRGSDTDYSARPPTLQSPSKCTLRRERVACISSYRVSGSSREHSSCSTTAATVVAAYGPILTKFKILYCLSSHSSERQTVERFQRSSLITISEATKPAARPGPGPPAGPLACLQSSQVCALTLFRDDWCLETRDSITKRNQKKKELRSLAYANNSLLLS